MSNNIRTVRTDIKETIAYEARTGMQIPVAIAPATLAALAAHDPCEAAFQLAWLQPGELEAEARAYAAYLNAKYQNADYTAEEVLTIFLKGIAKYGFTPLSAEAPAFEAGHTTPDTEESTMTTVTFDNDATITLACEPAPRVLVIDPAIVLGIRLLLETQHPGPQYSKALRTAIAELVEKQTPFVFDPITRILTLASVSRPGVFRHTNGADCDCPGAKHTTHWHVAAWDLVVMLEALTDPHGLLQPADVRMPATFERAA